MASALETNSDEAIEILFRKSFPNMSVAPAHTPERSVAIRIKELTAILPSGL
jgi:hypothetical protein